MQPGEKIITRVEAKAAGLKRYFTGEPCKHGHVAERLVCSKGCVECYRQRYKDNAAKKREYQRQWRENNPGYYRQWYKDNLERERKRGRRWYRDNPEKARERRSRWREDNPEYFRRRYVTDPTYRLAHQLRGMLRQILVGYAGEGKLSYVPESRVEAVRAKIDADFAAIPGAPGGYAEMDGSEWHIDHIVPLTVMIDLLPDDEHRSVLAYVASHPDMLRPLPAAENIARNNTLDADAEAALPRFWELVHEARAYHNDRKELET